ncbi:MAG: RNA polymerase sigma factor [Planctomycetota bacterium]|nr:RNA polymerase sigma factor [Planctomycetota bacterium]
MGHRAGDSSGRGPTAGFDRLVREAQAGDRGATDRILTIFEPYIRHLARYYAASAGAVESAEDLFQDSCLRAWEKIGMFEGGKCDEATYAMFRAWIAQIVKRRGFNSRRDQRRHIRSPPEKILSLDVPMCDGSQEAPRRLEAYASEKTPSEYARDEEMARKVREAIEELPDQLDAKIVTMKYFDGLTVAEICKELELGYDAVRNRYRAAERRLRRKLGFLEEDSCA